ncbi:Tim17/Tim22/Tim23/Pmp24 family-domain-containing protein [Flagelloscypha sp. PMI_526]|nr:Tim17/Tim22/Tim23/Pmp24 family-domain-containing protein [Flagelloscypha sp. PMI_526]
MPFPGQIPYLAPGQEPPPPGLTREEHAQTLKYAQLAQTAMESCAAKTVIAGVGGFAIGGFISLMNSAFIYEDPLLRAANEAAGKPRAPERARDVARQMGRSIWSSGRGFAKVGSLFAGIECCIEGYRAKNDVYNSVSAGFVAGGVLARNSGPKAMLGGGLAFAAFSAAIDVFFIRRETPDED